MRVEWRVGRRAWGGVMSDWDVYGGVGGTVEGQEI